MAEKERLDVLVQKLAGVSRSKAQGLIQTGQVLSNSGEILDKPGVRYDVETIFTIKAQKQYASRGGEKLAGAFDAFSMDIRGKVCLDAGASTGGFTDCMLQNGASKVYAVDVGYGQLVWELQQDPRVVVMDRFNVRHLSPSDLEERPEFFTVDCSFISLKTILPAITSTISRNAEGVVLIKPQFEAGRENVGKGGVVRDEKIRKQVVKNITDFCISLGFNQVDVVPSPLLGPSGNHEYLAYLHGFKVGNENNA